MSVMSCSRYCCPNVMCDRYSYSYGYICHECFSELIESKRDVNEFMESRKPENYKPKIEDYYDTCNSEFPIR